MTHTKYNLLMREHQHVSKSFKIQSAIKKLGISTADVLLTIKI